MYYLFLKFVTQVLLIFMFFRLLPKRENAKAWKKVFQRWTIIWINYKRKVSLKVFWPFGLTLQSYVLERIDNKILVFKLFIFFADVFFMFFVCWKILLLGYWEFRFYIVFGFQNYCLFVLYGEKRYFLGENSLFCCRFVYLKNHEEVMLSRKMWMICKIEARTYVFILNGSLLILTIWNFKMCDK